MDIKHKARLSTISEVSEISEYNDAMRPSHSISFIKYQREPKSSDSIVE